MDHNGSFVLARTISLHPMLNVKEGEALGILEALSWLKDLEIDLAIIRWGLSRGKQMEWLML